MPERQRLYHSPPPWVRPGEVFFVTICCARRRDNQLAQAEVFSVLVNAIEYYARAGRFWPHLFLAMPDHLHALLSFPSHERMDSVVRDWKRYVAKKAGVKWQDGFFDHRLRDHENFAEKAHYIRMNPVRAALIAPDQTWQFIWPSGANEPAR